MPVSYGRGLMPDTFIDFKKQRFRWAYGAMQILKAHARALFLEGGPLSPGQRYHFVAGWLPWVADGLQPAVQPRRARLVGGHGVAPQRIDPPLVMYSVLPLSLFTFKLAKLVHLYRVRVGANLRQTVAAAIAGLGADPHHRHGRGEGAAHPQRAVLPHAEAAAAPHRCRRSAAAREETLMMLALWAWAVGMLRSRATCGTDRTGWIVVLLVQSVPYASSLMVR